MTNIDLWMLKTGKTEPKDLDDNPQVIYGTKAEEHIRELFELDYPRFRVEYEPNNMWINNRMPWAHASLDLWMEDDRGRLGVGEIKTALITNSRQKAAWENRVPDHFYIQLIHNMAVCEAQFGILIAQLRWERDDDVFKITRHYTVNADDVLEEMIMLMEAEEKFWNNVQKGIEPAQILPEI